MLVEYWCPCKSTVLVNTTGRTRTLSSTHIHRCSRKYRGEKKTYWTGRQRISVLWQQFSESSVCFVFLFKKELFSIDFSAKGILTLTYNTGFFYWFDGNRVSATALKVIYMIGIHPKNKILEMKFFVSLNLYYSYYLWLQFDYV